jgi:predicted transcriptional regulator
MNDKSYKLKVSVSLDEDVIDKIKELADKDDRTFSAYINMVLKKHIQSIQ